MSLSEQINDDLKTAMKSKDSFTLGVIRMLKGFRWQRLMFMTISVMIVLLML